jgi:hypothetical protein
MLLGLRGMDAIHDDVRWTVVFSRRGITFLAIDQPAFLFANRALSSDGKKLLEELPKANFLLIVNGLDGPQTKLLLENAAKPG